MKTERVWINDQLILFATNVTFQNSIQYTYIDVNIQIKSNQVYLYTAYFDNDSGVFTVRKQ